MSLGGFLHLVKPEGELIQSVLQLAVFNRRESQSLAGHQQGAVVRPLFTDGALEIVEIAFHSVQCLADVSWNDVTILPTVRQP